MTHFFVKKNDIQLFYYFHVKALLFMSARPILGDFQPIFYGFLSKLSEIVKFSLKIMIFCNFEYFCSYLMQNSVWGGGGATFNFQPILSDIHEYTLKMTSYHVTDNYFTTEI